MIRRRVQLRFGRCSDWTDTGWLISSARLDRPFAGQRIALQQEHSQHDSQCNCRDLHLVRLYCLFPGGRDHKPHPLRYNGSAVHGGQLHRCPLCLALVAAAPELESPDAARHVRSRSHLFGPDVQRTDKGIRRLWRGFCQWVPADFHRPRRVRRRP